MGGRGSSFKDISKNVLDSLDVGGNEKQDYYTDFGEVSKDKETMKQNGLTNKLKNYNIIVCESMDNLNGGVTKMMLDQVQNLSQQYSGIVNGYLNEDTLKIRAYDMNQVSIKTGKKTPDFSTGALHDYITHQICINGRTTQSVEQLKKSSILAQKTNWSAKTDENNAEKSILTHEYGHFIQNCIIEKRLQKDVKKYSEYKVAEQRMQDKNNQNRLNDYNKFNQIRHETLRDITQDIIKIAFQKYNATKEDFSVSDYGDKNGLNEWFAEVFTEANLNSSSRVVTKAMKEFLNKEMEE